MKTLQCFKLFSNSFGAPDTIEMVFPQFHETRAHATLDAADKLRWEFDLCHVSGVQKHFDIAYTTSRDVLETLFVRAMASFATEVLG